MARTKYKKKIKNGIEYYFYRIKTNNGYKDLYGKTTKELEEKIKEIEKNIINNINIKGSKQNYGDFLRNWIYNVKFLNIKNTSKEVYISIYEKHIKNKSITKVKINELNRIMIQNYYAKLKKEKTGIPTIKIIHFLISGSIRYAYENDLIIKDFTKGLIIPKQSEEEKLKKINKVNPLTKEQQKKFIRAIEGNELELMYLMALYTGARQGELIALEWKDINLKNCTMNINKIAKYQHEINEEGNGEYKTEIQTPKTRKSIRKVPFPKELRKK